MDGYFRYPTIAGDTIVFVSEDDLWTVSAEGGTARRLTTGLGASTHPRLSPDGRTIAFSGTDEGVQEVYVVDAEGGTPRRLTWLGANTTVVGWTPDGRIALSTDARSPFFRDNRLFAVRPEGGEPAALPWGLAAGLDFSEDGGVVLCRHQEDLARWKRYRGGRTGRIWVDARGDGDFEPLIDLGGNLACPMWRDGRVWFLSDHEYTGNIYSCRPDGSDLQRHTHHETYYARYAATDGRRVVYTHAGDLWLLDDEPRRIEVRTRGPRTQVQRKFVAPERYLEHYALHPEGHSLALTVRGKPVLMGHWEGAPVQLGERHGVRHRLVCHLPDGRVVLVSDAGGREALEVHDAGEVTRLDLDVGRLTALEPGPAGTLVAYANHRYELGLIDLDAGTATVVDRAPYMPCTDLTWSADGAWLAYVRALGRWMTFTDIRLHEVASGTTVSATSGAYKDTCPSFDPDGRYLYFLSAREFDPVYDHVYFDLNFPYATRPYALVLQADGASPFLTEPRPLRPPDRPEPREPETPETRIDLDGLADRVLRFPVPEARYDQVAGLHGRVVLTRQKVVGAKQQSWASDGPPPGDKTLLEFAFDRQELVERQSGVTDFTTDLHRHTLAIRCGARLRVVHARAPDKDGRPSGEEPSRKTGWVDLSRATVAVDPRAEWRQMFHETWRLMRDHFWVQDMSGVDWPAMYERYAPLLERVGSRAEYSDLVWEMVGELGTSHAYEMMGDYRKPPSYRIGQLAASFAWQDGWRVTEVVVGEPGDPGRTSPLAAPGSQVRVGEQIVAVNGVPVDAETPPEALLVNRAGDLVRLDVRDPDGTNRAVTVRTLEDATPARYRDWVRANRERVHRETDERVGYVHIPDMGALGYGEFHRDYLRESQRDALIVDVRFNRGGHVSQLLLEKLARKPIAFTVARWIDEPLSYPAHTVLGPMVAITNELAGSDGDIFSHNFKQMGLGPLIGTRTWGGVIGIWPRHRHTDGSMTTQPEYSNWYVDVQWEVENYGTDPDIEVPIRPQDYADGRDPQLDKALEVVQERLEKEPFEPPEFTDRPYLGPPAATDSD